MIALDISASDVVKSQNAQSANWGVSFQLLVQPMYIQFSLLHKDTPCDMI